MWVSREAHWLEEVLQGGSLKSLCILKGYQSSRGGFPCLCDFLNISCCLVLVDYARDPKFSFIHRMLEEKGEICQCMSGEGQSGKGERKGGVKRM